jgi:kinesin family protein C1
MLNRIQELQGNVRVLACIRPFLSGDGEQGDNRDTPSVYQFSDEQFIVQKPGYPSEQVKFSFDHVFAPSEGEDVIFTEILELVKSALNGYNVCLILYGQTGSGKTHTMSGLIPRCLKQIGHHKFVKERDGWQFLTEVTNLEIYNESLKDLLRDNNSRACELKIIGSSGTDSRLSVKNLTVKGNDPNDTNAIEKILVHAARLRTTDSTDMNDKSSRSHEVLTLNITAKHRERNQVVRGTLNLVDLAGSERLGHSNRTREQLLETKTINQSLASLVSVFHAIGENKTHIPFLESNLTKLLKPFLSVSIYVVV